jgi:hypothetical protein
MVAKPTGCFFSFLLQPILLMPSQDELTSRIDFGCDDLGQML